MPVSWIEASQRTFAANKSLADRAIAQVADDQLRQRLDENTNSIAVIMKHVGGNLRSRWTNFLSTDGEKQDRNRDDEFVDTFRNRAEILECWDLGWTVLFESLVSLTEDDLDRDVTIRGVKHTVPHAIQRSLGHTCYHVGQIIFIARIHAGHTWTTLTIPVGESERYNRDHWGI